jgi:hypothetical protein
MTVPLLAMFVKTAGPASLKSSRLPAFWRLLLDLRDLRNYLNGPARNDPPDVREGHIRRVYDRAVDAVAALQPVVEYLVQRLLAETADQGEVNQTRAADAFPQGAVWAP